jgi:hypothetical protein
MIKPLCNRRGKFIPIEYGKVYYIIDGLYYDAEEYDKANVRKAIIMEITKWEELNEKIINGFEISVNDEWMTITKRNWYCMDIYYLNVPTDQIIAHLMLLGVDIKFKEEIILSQDY